jgi:hypothetical protein
MLYKKEHLADNLRLRIVDWLASRYMIFLWITMVSVLTDQAGQTDLSAKTTSVDFSLPQPRSGDNEDSEHYISRNFTYFSRIVRVVARMATAYSRIRARRTDWGVKPEFIQLASSLDS